MKYLKTFLVILFFLVGISAQPSEKREVPLYVQVPRNIALSVIAVQPNCPIAFEEVVRLAGIEGGFSNSYRLRNIGTKPIRALTVGTSSGTVWSMPKEEGTVIMPGELVPEADNYPNNVIPLTSNLRTRLKLEGPMKSIVVLMVLNVEFTDGSSFDDERTFREMTAFMDKIGDSLRRHQELKNKPVGKPR